MMGCAMATAAGGGKKRTTSAPSTASTPGRSARAMEHALAQEIGLRPAVHLAFQQLQPGDVAFSRAVAVRLAQGGGDGGVILAQAFRATPELGDVPAARPVEPG